MDHLRSCTSGITFNDFNFRQLFFNSLACAVCRAVVNNDCVNLQSCLVNLLKASETLQRQFPPVVNRRDDFNLFSSSIHLAQTLLNRFRHFQCRLPTQNRFRFAHIGDSDSHIVFERHGRFKL